MDTGILTAKGSTMTTCVETCRDRQGWRPWYGALAVFAVLSVGLIMALVYAGQDMQRTVLSPGRGLTLGSRYWVMTGLAMLGWVGSGLWLLGMHVGASRTETRYLVGAGVSGMALVEALLLLAFVVSSLGTTTLSLGTWLVVALCASTIVGLALLTCWCWMRVEHYANTEESS
jgi:hypothetical protein